MSEPTAGAVTPATPGPAPAGVWRQPASAPIGHATSNVDVVGHDPASDERLARTAWWLDDAVACLDAQERAYRGYVERGDTRAAARSATTLGYDTLLFGRGASVARGWLGRAADLLDDVAEGPEHGWLAVRRAEVALAADRDPVAARRCAEQAGLVGRRTGADDLVVVANALSGLARTMTGEVAAGMALLDTAAAQATGGDLADDLWMGKVCCWLIMACQETQDLDRAQEWCRRVETLCLHRDLGMLLHVCRVHYASLQVTRGAWAVADRDLSTVVAAMSTSTRATRLDAVVQLGELRRRQGRVTEAEELLSQAEFHPVAVAGRALIRLSRGENDLAWAAVGALLRTIPASHRLDRALVLPAAVTIAVAAGDTVAADAACVELETTAGDVGTPALAARAAAARAEVASAADPGASVDLWRDAVRRFQVVGMRFDEAEARVALAQALLARGEDVLAAEHAAAAAAEFAALGAQDAAARAARPARSAPERPGPLSPREIEVLALIARGHSNADIAHDLMLSPHTVHRHVGNILTKLGQPSRAAATAYALTHDLI